MKEESPNTFKIQGKVVCVMPEITIEGKNGQSYMKEYVIETNNEYSTCVAFVVYGKDKITKFDVKKNDQISVLFNIISRNIGGKWFTCLYACNIFKIGTNEPNKSISKKEREQNIIDTLPF